MTLPHNHCHCHQTETLYSSGNQFTHNSYQTPPGFLSVFQVYRVSSVGLCFLLLLLLLIWVVPTSCLGKHYVEKNVYWSYFSLKRFYCLNIHYSLQTEILKFSMYPPVTLYWEVGILEVKVWLKKKRLQGRMLSGLRSHPQSLLFSASYLPWSQLFYSTIYSLPCHQFASSPHQWNR